MLSSSNTKTNPMLSKKSSSPIPPIMLSSSNIQTNTMLSKKSSSLIPPVMLSVPYILVFEGSVHQGFLCPWNCLWAIVKFLHLYKVLLFFYTSGFQKHHKMSKLCFVNKCSDEIQLSCLDEMGNPIHYMLHKCSMSNLSNLETQTFTNVFVRVFYKYQPLSAPYLVMCWSNL